MIINKSDYNLIDRKNEGIWNFYIKDNSIYYKIINQDICKEETILIDNIKNYDINIDSENNIHLICVTYSGEFCYFTYSNNEWKKTIIEEYDPELNSIDYLDIIIIDKIIHVFYSFRNVINKNLLNIIHYIYDDKWKVNYLEQISLSNNTTNPYFVDYHPNGDIFLLFKEEKETYLRIFNLSSRTWKESQKIKCSIDDADVINFFIDNKYNINLIYKNNATTIHAVNNSGDISNYDKWSKNILVEEIEDINFSIFEVDTKLYIIWRNEEFLYCKYSDDFGISWMKERKFKYDNIYSICYKGNEYKDTKLLEYINTFGNIKDNEISLVGIDDNILFCTEILEEPIEENENLESNRNNSYDEQIIQKNDSEEYIKEDSLTIVDDVNFFRSNIKEESVSQKNNETFFQKLGKYF
ncbi:hypothetical protein [Tepidibacter sp. Z1-5]|uniref:hypothetical protein n=1 Tax=Tepidibacter sp. Z1-5 TaxID=3134138 RepID=UPI0030BAACEA